MITCPKVSRIAPECDETLISFLRRAQLDAQMPKADFDLLVAGAPLPDARTAERRRFNFEALSELVNASASRLHAMSERSIFFKREDGRHCTRHLRQAPWLGTKGYGKHCPCCLKSSGHWRKEWLSPVAMVCEKHGTLLLDQCSGCGGKLEEMIWSNAGPLCPSCGFHLSLGPTFRAPDEIVHHAAVLRRRYAVMISAAPVCLRERELAEFAAAYRAKPWILFFPESLLILQDKARIGPLADVTDAGSAAWHSAQMTILAHTISELWPQFSERLWLSGITAAGRRDPDHVISIGLNEFCSVVATLILTPPASTSQSLLSFEGPKAAIAA